MSLLVSPLLQPSVKTLIETFYLAFYDRAADPAGLEYYTQLASKRLPYAVNTFDFSDPGDLRNGGADLITQFGRDFVYSSEAKSQSYWNSPSGGVFDSGKFVDKLFFNLSGQHMAFSGILFWQTVIDNGSVDVGQAVASIVNNLMSMGDSFSFQGFQNKISASDNFTTQVANSKIVWNSAVQAESTKELNNVNYNPATLQSQTNDMKVFIQTVGHSNDVGGGFDSFSM